MAQVTDGDRERAGEVIGAVLADQVWLTNKNMAVRDHVAAALAEEREKARAPFLAALADLEGEVDLLNPHTPGTPGYHGANGLKTGIAYAISKVRRATEEPAE